MKKLIMGTLIVLSGCYEGETCNITGSPVRKVEIDGHLYLYVSGVYEGGGICHAESCPCKESGAAK